MPRESQRLDDKYDVAISFLSSDEGLARELRDLLSSGLRMFLRVLSASCGRVLESSALPSLSTFCSRPWIRAEHDERSESCEA